MAEDQPIVQATAKLRIEIDRADYDRFKEGAERDFADLKERFASVFKVELDAQLAPLREILERIEKLGGGSSTGNTQAEQQQERVQSQPDQVLAKLTIIEDNTERTAKGVEELVETMTSST